MKKVFAISAVIFFSAALLSSCKTHDNCPAYGKAPVKEVGKSV